jgi:ABC-3C protein
MSGEFKDIPAPPAPAGVIGPDQAAAGLRFLPQQQILLYSSDEWEAFVHEWAHYCLKKLYTQVQRFTGAGDRGIDIAGFVDAAKLQGIWDNYQCKHYDHALQPGDALPEIGKVLWHTFNNAYRVPRRYYFVAPHGVGTTLAGHLADPAQLKETVIAKWETQVADKITKTQSIILDGAFLAYVQAFDFSIFDAKTSLEIIEQHRDSCSYHATRFGGGLPPRPDPGAPPEEIAPTESRYIAQLLEAYADHKQHPVPDVHALKAWPPLNEHFRRQRESFYHAESLRVFARDTVPPGTFESLQEEIHYGVRDVHDADHPDGYVRVRKVVETARGLNITANALITRTHLKDRDGICHQLANEDRLKWIKP